MKTLVFMAGFIFGLYIAYGIGIRQAIDDAIDEALLSADDQAWLEEVQSKL